MERIGQQLGSTLLCKLQHFKRLICLDGLIGGFAHYQRLQSSSRDDDCVDHLNHIYTVITLVVFAIFVSGKQYVGNPIECFSEDLEFGYSKREYARTYCWLQNTYRAGTQSPLPREKMDRKAAEIPYYQWVPIILLVLAAMFKLPNLLWRAASVRCGLDLTQLSSLVNKSQLMAADKSREAVQQMAEYVDRWLSSQNLQHSCVNGYSRCLQVISSRCPCLCCWRSQGTYLTGLYIFTKFLFLFNSIIVLILLWHALGSWYVDFGLKLLSGSHGQSLRNGVDDNGFAWPELPYFPKLTFCDFSIRQQTNINTHTMQCALPINMFNEKIFTFLWFWITFVTVANGISFIQWILKCQYGSLHPQHICDILEKHGDLITDYDRHVALNFGQNYLRRDGCFVFHVILANSNILVTGDLLSQLFVMYRNKTCVKKEKGGGEIMYV